MPRRDEPDLYLGLDLGTSGVRAVAVDRCGGRRAVTSAPLEPPLRGPAGASEQDPDYWWHALVAVIRQLTARLTRYGYGRSVAGPSIRSGAGFARPDWAFR